MKKSELESLIKDIKDHIFSETFLSYTLAYYVVKKGTEKSVDSGVIHIEFEFAPENLFNILIQKETDIYVKADKLFTGWFDIIITEDNLEEVLTMVFKKINSDDNLEIGISLINTSYLF